jgi:hypothetical protein
MQNMSIAQRLGVNIRILKDSEHSQPRLHSDEKSFGELMDGMFSVAPNPGSELAHLEKYTGAHPLMIGHGSSSIIQSMRESSKLS